MRIVKCLVCLLLVTFFVVSISNTPVTGEEIAVPEFKTQREKIAYYKKQKEEGNLQVGDEAPDFTLKKVDGKELVQLSSFKGKREVVLIFGSYT